MFSPNDHLIDLKGKQYLQVMWRLVWFREDHPLWNIDTKLEQLTENHAVFSAKISDENGAQKASGYGSEGVKDFRDFIEKAETKAIGRALAMLGYGTQFAPELEEGERLVDSPVGSSGSKQSQNAAIPACESCGKPIKPVQKRDGTIWNVTDMITYSRLKFGGKALCGACMKAAQEDAKHAG